MFWVINGVSLVFFFRGHNAPGGGFIAGVITALAYLMLYMIRGEQGMKRYLPCSPLSLALGGVSLAFGVAMAPLVVGQSFLMHTMWHFALPMVGKIHIGSAALFDVGVAAVVVGVVIAMVTQLDQGVKHG